MALFRRKRDETRPVHEWFPEILDWQHGDVVVYDSDGIQEGKFQGIVYLDNTYWVILEQFNSLIKSKTTHIKKWSNLSRNQRYLSQALTGDGYNQFITNCAESFRELQKSPDN